MTFANVRELKLETQSVLQRARKRGVIITYRGKPWAVIERLDESSLEDYVLTHHPKLKKLLATSWKEWRAGQRKSLRKLAEELGIDL